jgi:hypothetical protein
MACARCGNPDPATGPRWCAVCERGYDAWSRRHAGDVVWAVLAGMVIVVSIGMGLPLLGVSWLAAAGGVFAGFGAFVGLHRLNGRRRRRQYLRGGEVPRAYLPGKT